MAGKKGYEDPDRGRGIRETPGHGEKGSEGNRDRDFRSEHDKKHENPMKNPDERSPREPRT